MFSDTVIHPLTDSAHLQFGTHATLLHVCLGSVFASSFFENHFQIFCFFHGLDHKFDMDTASEFEYALDSLTLICVQLQDLVRDCQKLAEEKEAFEKDIREPSSAYFFWIEVSKYQ